MFYIYRVLCASWWRYQSGIMILQCLLGYSGLVLLVPHPFLVLKHDWLLWDILRLWRDGVLQQGIQEGEGFCCCHKLSWEGDRMMPTGGSGPCKVRT